MQLIVRSRHSGLEYEVIGQFGDFFLCSRLTSNGTFALHAYDVEII